MVKNVLDTVKAASELAASVSETEDGTKAKDELGKAALTVTKAFNNVLAPVSLINHGFDKARDYYNNVFKKDVERVTDSIPVEDLREPNPALISGAVTQLGFVTEEPSLKEMYLNLIATSMDCRKAGIEHPSYVSIVEQLSSEEAETVVKMLKHGIDIALGQIRFVDSKTQTFWIKQKYLLDVRDSEKEIDVEVPSLELWINNWQRLGLIDVTFDRQIDNDELYSKLEERSEFKILSVDVPDGQIVKLMRGKIEPTSFGKNFAQAVSSS